jgi:hypothetical protein
MKMLSPATTAASFAIAIHLPRVNNSAAYFVRFRGSLWKSVFAVIVACIVQPKVTPRRICAMKRTLLLSTLFAFLGVSVAMADAPALSKPAETAAFCAIQENSSEWLKSLDPTKGAVDKANCGAFTCTGTQVCIYCGNSLSCRPQGDTCCYPGFCSAGQTCIQCGAFKNCYPAGSTCCDGTYGLVCSPAQRCDWINRQCVPR